MFSIMKMIHKAFITAHKFTAGLLKYTPDMACFYKSNGKFIQEIYTGWRGTLPYFLVREAQKFFVRVPSSKKPKDARIGTSFTRSDS